MTTPVLDLSAVFRRDPAAAHVVVADGYGIRLAVERGHLVVHDGLGRHRRTRRFSRAERTVRRVVVLGHTGTITLDAVAWCQHVGISIVQIDGTQVVSVSGASSSDDARLRRQQALAASNDTGLAVARALLHTKLTGQAAVLSGIAVPAAAELIAKLAVGLATAGSISACRDIEATAANVYFGSWAGRVTARFATRDADHVPDHWHVFDARRSTIQSGRTPRKAAAPINALLNYGYALAEAECRLAALAVGLDPGLGIVHVDKKARDSLALDLLEAIRPVVDQHVLDLLATRHLRSADFHETPDGSCRLLPPLTHAFADALPTWARTVAPVAESVAHQLAHASTAPIPLRTPLTQANVRRTQAARQTPAPQTALLAQVTCRVCGTVLPERRRQLCSGCWSAERRALASERAKRGTAAIAEKRAHGNDPTNTTDAAARRNAALARNWRNREAWERDGGITAISEEQYDVVINRLLAVPLSKIAQATGLSLASCSRIRAGQLRAHRRHWAALASLVSASTPATASTTRGTCGPPQTGGSVSDGR